MSERRSDTPRGGTPDDAGRRELHTAVSPEETLVDDRVETAERGESTDRAGAGDVAESEDRELRGADAQESEDSPADFRDTEGPSDFRDSEGPADFRDREGPSDFRDREGPSDFRDVERPVDFRDQGRPLDFVDPSVDRDRGPEAQRPGPLQP